MNMRLPQLLGVCSVVGLCSVGVAFAQTTPAAKPAKAAHTAMAASTVTGCVAQGADAKHFTLKADDGTAYDLSGAGLKAHVGHKVEVTGTPGKAKTAGSNAPLHAKAVKMVAATCS